MPESLGKQLQASRVQRGLSLEEAAHATKLRPDKILALESDDYARFGNNVYAKGFLQIYSRYLGVDATEFAARLDSSNPISVQDYQYLTNGVSPREPDRAGTFSFHPKRQIPSFVPLIAFAVLLVLGFVGFQVYVDWKRVTSTADAAALPAQTAESSPAATVAAGVREASAAALLPVAAEHSTPTVPNPVQPPAAALPAQQSTAAPAPVTAMVSNEVLVEPLRKTLVTIRRGDPKSAPVFEDFLYPDAPPLKVKGARIFIEARDPSAIQIRKNGAPIAYQPPGVEIR